MPKELTNANAWGLSSPHNLATSFLAAAALLVDKYPYLRNAISSSKVIIAYIVLKTPNMFCKKNELPKIQAPKNNLHSALFISSPYWLFHICQLMTIEVEREFNTYTYTYTSKYINILTWQNNILTYLYLLQQASRICTIEILDFLM